MSIITISRGSYSKGKEVAEKVAKRLNYAVVSRDIILEASKDFNIPEIKLIRALHDAPSVLERFTFGRKRYLAYIESAILEHLRRDNVVYHGLAGHFFLKGISHVLKVRIIAALQERVKTEMAREGISKQEALEILKKDDHERRQWSLKLYGIDTWDSSLYDLVLHVRKLTVENAADIICDAVKREQFKTTPESRKALDELRLAARVKAEIIEKVPNLRVTSREGLVLVVVRASQTYKPEMVEEIRRMAEKVQGVKEVKVELVPATLFE